MKYFNFETDYYHPVHGWITVHLEGNISKLYPARMYNSRGDPGDDAEGGEIEYDVIELWDEDDNYIDEPFTPTEEMDEQATENAI